ncbi:thioredoxin 1, partial [Tremellales sp. Uapishka_1]
MAPGITEISSTAEFDTISRGLPPSQLMVIDFHATWCGPCLAIAPLLAQMATRYQHVKFIKIDVDKQAALAQRYRVSAMPTFKFIKGGREVAELKGASPPQLTALIAHHAGPVPSSGAAASSSSSSASASAPAAPADNTISLLPYVTSKGLTCLNEAKDHGLKSIVGNDAGPKGRSYLESDVDPELLISLPFNETVKIKAISIFSGVSPSQAPKNIKLFINHVSLDFADASSLAPAQEFTLSPEDIKGNRIDVRFVRFQNVRSLHILVQDNQEDEETTRIDSLDIFGTVGELVDKGPLKRNEHEH